MGKGRQVIARHRNPDHSLPSCPAGMTLIALIETGMSRSGRPAEGRIRVASFDACDRRRHRGTLDRSIVRVAPGGGCCQAGRCGVGDED